MNGRGKEGEGEKVEGRVEGRPLSVKWMKRGKRKRQTAKDGICSNQGICRYIYIYIYIHTLFSFLPPPSSHLFRRLQSYPPLPLFTRFLLPRAFVLLFSFLLVQEFIKPRFQQGGYRSRSSRSSRRGKNNNITTKKN